MAPCRIYYNNFSLKNKYFYIFSIYNRQFCSKKNDVISEGSGLKKESSKENPNEEAKGSTSNKTEAFQIKSTPLTDIKIEAAKQKLKSLLSEITVTSEKTAKSSLNLAKPVKRISRKERLAKIEAEKITPEKTMNTAVKAVASTFKEDSEKVESELKEKLSTLNLVKKDSVVEETQPPQPVLDSKLNENLMSSVKEVADTISESPIPPRSELAKRLLRISLDQKISPDGKKSMSDNKLNEDLVSSVKEVADTISESPIPRRSELAKRLMRKSLDQKISPDEKKSISDSKLNEDLISSVKEVADSISESPMPRRSELAKRLMRISLDEKISPDEKKSMRSVIEGMVIKKMPDKEKAPKRSKQIFEKPSKERYPATKKIIHVNLFGAAPLNIFDPVTEMKPESSNTLWQKLQEREVRLLTEFAPANAFEEMIRWTEQGKHWKFPINNEAEIGKEENVGFHEHVFLQKHLKGFPTKGPIRHFMELVCVGLSKNPYITVERKIENIEWFRSYFKEKEELLRESGALD